MVVALELLFVLLVKAGLPAGHARFQRGAHALQALRRCEQLEFILVHAPQFLAADEQLAVQPDVGEIGAKGGKRLGALAQFLQKRLAALVAHGAHARLARGVEQQLFRLLERRFDLLAEDVFDDLPQRARAYVLFSQIGQHGGYVLRKSAAGGKDLYAAGVERVALAIHEEGRAVHGDGGLARSRAAHHGDHPRVFIADGGGLLRLNGGHHLAHVAAGGLGEQVEEDAVANVELRINVVLEAAVLHAILALERHLAANLARGAVVAAAAGHGIVVERADRRAPVVHQHLPIPAPQAVQADDDLFRVFLALLGEVDAGEEGRHQHALVARGQIVGERLAHKVSIHLGGKLLKVLRRKRGRLHAQLVPRIGHDHVHSLGVAGGDARGLLDDGEQELLHALRIFLFGAKHLWIVHIRPSLGWRRRSASFIIPYPAANCKTHPSTQERRPPGQKAQ